MPTFTVSATGGNWSSTSTWVGGVLPAAGDDIVANATSGPLTVDSNRTCLTINFTNYTNTFRINNGVTLTVSGTAITLFSGMTYDQTTTGILNTNGNQAAITVTFNGITIPNLTVGKSGAGISTLTVSGANPTVRNFVFSNTASNAQLTLSGVNLIITNSFSMNSAGTLAGNTPIFTGSVTLSQTGGNMNVGFTVSSGSTLTLGSNITSIAGNITFASGSFLIVGTFTVTITSNCTLDSSNVTWYNIHTSSNGHTITLNSDLNISNNLTWAITGFAIQIVSATVRTITVQGSVTSTAGYNRTFNLNNIILNLVGTGTFAVAWITPSVGTTCSININTSNPTGYVIGSSTFTGVNSMQLASVVFTLVGTSVASAFNGTTLYLNSGTLDTNRSSVGGSNPSYSNLIIFQGATFLTDTTVLGNVSLTSSNTGCVVSGAKILIGLSLTIQAGVTSTGTTTFEFTGSNGPASWGAGTYQNNVTINKSGGVLNLPSGTITWGASGRVLEVISGIVNPSTSTISIPFATSVTINNMTFWDLTLSGVTVTQNALNTIQNNLICNGSVTFTGTSGWTTKNFTCTTAASTITLQNINANPLAEYTVTGVLTLIGTLASRILLQAAGSATFNGTINPVGQLNYLTGTAPSVGMTVSQSTGVSPAGLIGLLPNRPVITGGTSPTFTISPAATAVIGASFSMRAGYKAKFTLANNGTSSQNVAYVTTQDIDSSAGVTITSFGSNGDNVNNSTIALFRTLNWGPLVAPSGSVYYTWVE